MMSQSNVELITIIVRERHADLLREAQSERQFRCLNNVNKTRNRLPWGIGRLIPKFNVLRPSAG